MASMLPDPKLGWSRHVPTKQIQEDEKLRERQDSLESSRINETIALARPWTPADDHETPDDPGTGTTSLAPSGRQSSHDDYIPDNDGPLSTLPSAWKDFIPSPGDDEDAAEELDEDKEEADWSKKLVKRSNEEGQKSGLSLLENLDQLVIRHHVQLYHIYMGFQKRNQFEICRDTSHANSHKLFVGRDDTDWCSRLCLPERDRPFDIIISDGQGHQVISLSRNLCACGPCCCCLPAWPCCLQSLDVYGYGGCGLPFHSEAVTFLLGRIEQQCSWWPKFKIFNDEHQVVMKIRGRRRFCPPSLSLCSDIHFDIFAPPPPRLGDDLEEGGGDLDLDKRKKRVLEKTVVVGNICRKWPGLCSNEMCRGDGDNFEINFPPDMDTKMKAVLVGAAILIDLIYFEDSIAAQQQIVIGGRDYWYCKED